MQIGIDCRLPTYQMGGISQYVIHLIAALHGLSGDERFRIFHSYKESRQFAPPNDSRFSRSDLFTPCHHRLERYTLGIELIRHRPDVFHSPDFIPPAFGAGRRVITVHDVTFLYYPQFLTAESRRYYPDQIGWAISAADHIIADSEATRVDLIKLLNVAPEKVTTIHLAANPIFTGEHAPDEIVRTAAKYGVGRGFILSVGTLEPRKNLPTLIQAYHRLRQQHHFDAPLVLVGGAGWIYDEIFRSIAELQLTDFVRHLTGVSDIELAHLYRAAGALAFPSYYEGFGLPALEAMHSGCPVLASNRGSLPEVVGAAAISLDPDDLDAWVEGLHRILSDDSLAKRLRRAGREQAQKFSWANTAAKTLEVYRSV
jgi:glycosyltransferase involved in cell wall biosynthesis